MPTESNNLPAKTSSTPDPDIDSILKRIAKKHGIPPKRLRKLAPELQKCGWLDNASSSVCEQAETNLDVEFRTYGANRLLDILEVEDLEKFRRHMKVCAHLKKPTLPIFTLDEITGQMAAFCNYLLRNRDSFINTGFPKTMFVRAPWLYCLFPSIYPTRHPHLHFPNRDFDAVTCEEGEFYIDYVWTREHAKGNFIYMPLSDKHRGTATTDLGEQVILCKYEEAEQIPGDLSYPIGILDELRRKAYHTSLDILWELLASVTARKAEGLQHRIAQIVNEHLYEDERKMLLEADTEFEYNWYAGLLKQLFFLVITIQFDLETLSVDKTCSTLQALDFDFRKQAYIDVIGRPDRIEIDAALDEYYDVLMKRLASADDYGNALMTALEKSSTTLLSRKLAPGRKLLADIEMRVLDSALRIVNDTMALESIETDEVKFKAHLDKGGVTWRNRWCYLTDKQLAIVSLLIKSKKQGIDYLKWKIIQERCGIGSEKIYFLFRKGSRNEKLLGEQGLIVPYGAGNYGLNPAVKKMDLV